MWYGDPWRYVRSKFGWREYYAMRKDDADPTGIACKTFNTARAAKRFVADQLATWGGFEP